MGRRREQLVAAGVVPIVVLAVLEFVIITFGLAPQLVSPLILWNPGQDDQLTSEEGEFRRHHSWIWEPRPGAVVHGDPINDDAMRGPAVPHEKRVGLRIAVLGDSSTYGFGLRERDSWGRMLEAILRGYDVDVDVVNGGVIGYTLEQGYRVYVGKVRDFRPDIVIAAFGAVNDHFKQLMTDRAKIDLLSHPMFRLRQFFERYGAFRWLARAIEGPRPVQEIGEADVTARVPVDAFARRLVDLKRAVEEDGARLVLVSPPRRVDGEAQWKDVPAYTAALDEVAAREGIPLVPVRDVFRRLDEQELGEKWEVPAVGKQSKLFLDQWHPSVRGHRLYAVTVGEVLLKSGLLPSLSDRPEILALFPTAGTGDESPVGPDGTSSGSNAPAGVGEDGASGG